MNGRHELKHSVRLIDFYEIERSLSLIASLDSHSKDGLYTVHSLYFDNYSNKVLREKKDGLNNREKFRIRFYNHDFSFINLEKKSKKNGISHKQSSKISKSECESILNGNYDFLKESNDPLKLEFYTKIHFQQLRPKNIVVYDRKAYIYHAGNTRVTFDFNLSTSFDIQNFFNLHRITIPIKNSIILEIKYDSFLPEIIKNLVHLQNRHSSSFSKYAASRII